MVLLRRHGKELCFAGVILNNESTMMADKRRGLLYKTLARMLGAEGAIISRKAAATRDRFTA